MDAYELARSAWPEVDVPRDVAMAYVQERAGAPERLDPRRLQELYLACGCARGDRAALSIFSERYVSAVSDGLGRTRWPRAVVEDVLQQVRVTLLVAAPGGTPRIAQYQGAGSLLSWVKVIAVRALQKRAGQAWQGEEVELDAVAERLWSGGNQERDALLRRHRTEILAVVREAVRALEPEDRAFLQLGVLQGVSTVKLGRLYAMNQSTAWRKLERIKQALTQAIHERLKARFDLSSRELESMVDALRSSLDLSISQLFGDEDGDESGGADA